MALLCDEAEYSDPGNANEAGTFSGIDHSLHDELVLALGVISSSLPNPRACHYPRQCRPHDAGHPLPS